jgi:hypothetical protein
MQSCYIVMCQCYYESLLMRYGKEGGERKTNLKRIILKNLKPVNIQHSNQTTMRRSGLHGNINPRYNPFEKIIVYRFSERVSA